MRVVLSGEKANSNAMQDYLRQGHRWFVIDDPFIFYDPIDLDLYADRPFLTLEGAGLARSVMLKGFTGAPMISHTGLWHHNWRGIEISDFDRWYDEKPMIDLQQVDRSVFDGVVLHGGSLSRIGYPTDESKPTRCSTTAFNNMEIRHGVNGGLHVYNGVNLHFTRPIVEFNGRQTVQGVPLSSVAGKVASGLRWYGPHPGHPDYWSRGHGTITAGHFELAGDSGYYGLELNYVRRVRIRDNMFLLAHTLLGPNTERVRFYDNEMGVGALTSRVFNSGSNNEVSPNSNMEPQP